MARASFRVFVVGIISQGLNQEHATRRDLFVRFRLPRGYP